VPVVTSGDADPGRLPGGARPPHPSVPATVPTAGRNRTRYAEVSVSTRAVA